MLHATLGPAVPAPARGIELVGPIAGSGHQRPPSLVRRADGQVLQLTPVLYAVLEAVDGRRDLAAIASTVAERHGVALDAEDVAFLVEERLRPLGVLRGEDGSEPARAATAAPLLGLRAKVVVANPAVTDRLTAPFAPLFAAPVVAAVLVAFVAVSWWLLVHEGLATAAHDVLHRPALLLTAFALTAVSAGFHELGHAAACRYAGARAGAMGVGLYLVWPAFYTDVSDTYRLARRDRLRVDLGGLYFNAIFAVASVAVAVVTGWDALLVLVPLQQLQMLQQLVPLVRLDGYHILADLVGVPDLYAHIRPTLRRVLPWRRTDDPPLKRWARWVVTAWVVVVVPALALALCMLALALPRLAATAGESIGRQASALADAWTSGDLGGAGVRVVGIAAIVVPLASSAYLLARIARRTLRRAWRSTDGRPVARSGLVAALVALVIVAAAAWWPDGQYEPITEGESGTVVDGLRALGAVGAPDPEPSASFVVGADRVTVPLQLAVADGTDGERYRFRLPAPPGEGDNQALAVNEVDGSRLVDVALSLVWDTDGVVDGVNAAWALASCRDCTTAAFAFQVVLVVGDAEIVVPQNLAVAVNRLCGGCVTHALAIQLIATITRPLDEGALARIDAIWRDLQAVAAAAASAPVEQTEGALRAAEQQLREVLAPFLVPGEPPTTSSSATSATTATTVDTAVPAPAASAPTTAATTPPTEPSTTTTEPPTTTASSSTTTTTTAPTSTTTATTEEPTTTTEAP